MFGAKDMYGFSSLFMTKHNFGLLQTYNEFRTNFVEIGQIISAYPLRALSPGRSLSTNLRE